MSSDNLKFPKSQKLKSRKEIAAIFEEGKFVKAYPLKAFYRLNSLVKDGLDAEPLRMSVTASKRSFKSAVDRNRVKRVIREAFRLQKDALHQYLIENKLSLNVMFLYQGRELPDHIKISKAMKKVISKLQQTK